MMRAYEIVMALALAACGYGALRAVWFDPGDTIEDVPKDARSTPGAYRSHYRHVFIHGGK